MSFLGDAFKSIKSVVRSPVTKMAAGGLAVVFPAVGVPAVAGLAIASKTLDTVDDANHARTKLTAVRHAKAAKVTAARAGKVAHPTQRAALVQKARDHQRSAIKLARKDKRMERARSNLAKKLEQTRKLAEAGDVGAQRALATFQLVAKAKAGDPQALAAAKAIRDRHDIGQAIRTHFHLHPNGRLTFLGPVRQPQARLGADWFANVRVGNHRFEGHGSIAGDNRPPPPWVADVAIWNRAKAVVKPHWNRASDPWAVVTTVYKRMGGRVA